MRVWTMVVWFAVGCSTLPGPVRSDGPEDVPAAPESPRTRPGSEVLELRARAGGVFELVNVSATPQDVLPALDGSDFGWRVPSLSVEYRDKAGQPVPFALGGRCGNMNPLRAEDFVTLAPGASLALPGQWMSLQPPEGAVEARLTYDTRTQGGRDLGDLRADPAEMLAKLPEGVWTSNWSALSP
ncbi:MAG: hypothetical protein R3F61_14250 [Myxococcota bacterium]